MNFDKLNEMIPHVRGGKLKILEAPLSTGVFIAMPGRHAEQTEPIGGDFVVMVSDETKDWTKHQFTHTDLFKDLQEKRDADYDVTNNFMGLYLEVIKGEDPDNFRLPGQERLPGIHFKTLLYSVQALAVAEHRRYAKFEPKFGGRFLPFRFSTGIAEEKWDASDAAGMQKKGRPGVEILEKLYGRPYLTEKLINGIN